MNENNINVQPFEQIVEKTEKGYSIPIPSHFIEVLGIKRNSLVKCVITNVTPSVSPEIMIPLIPASEVVPSAELVKDEYVCSIGAKKVGKGRISIYDVRKESRAYIKASLLEKDDYFYGLGKKTIEAYDIATKHFYIVLLAGDAKQAYIFPWEEMKEWIKDAPLSNGQWKITIDKRNMLRITGEKPMDVSKYLNRLDILK